jgi:hypothetical protein
MLTRSHQPRHRSRVRLQAHVLVAFASLFGTLVLLGSNVSSASEASSWSSPVLVDRHPLAHSNEELLQAVSCPSLSLCVAVGQGVFESRNPTAPAPVWTEVPGSHPDTEEVTCPSASLCVAARHLDALQEVVSFDPSYTTTPAFHATHVAVARIACPSVMLCVGSDGGGGLVISTDPGSTDPTWRHYPTVYESREGSGLSALSCASVRFCLGVDPRGQLVSSTDPGASVPHWHVTYAPGPYLHSPAVGRYLVLSDVSCPSVTFCMVADENGKVLTSSDPSAPRPTWRVHPAPVFISRLSCPSTRLCVGNIQQGIIVATNDPGAARPTWTRTTLPDQNPLDRFDRSATTLTCLPASTTCVVAATTGDVFVGTGL